MLITKQNVAEKIAAYLHHDITLAQLVDWAENALMDGEFADANSETNRPADSRDGEFEERSASSITSVVSRIGVADVRAFGLTWEDCEDLLKQLGFVARVDIVVA